MKNEKEPVFIVGIARSGTTLLSMMLNAHSQIAISPETHYFTRHKKIVDRFINSKNVESISYISQYLFNRREFKDFSFSKYDIENIKKCWFTNEILTHRKILECILIQYSKNFNKNRWGEKTPNHYLCIPMIKKYFQNAKFISIVRDPRDVSLSLREMPWSNNNVLKHALIWKRYNIMSDKYKYIYGNDYLEVRFEDLINNPEIILREICDVLNLKFEYNMVNPENSLETFNIKREPWKLKALGRIDKNNNNKWRSNMQEHEAYLFELIAKKHIKTQDYILSNNSIGIRLFIKTSILIMGNSFSLIFNKLLKYYKYIKS